MRKTLLLFVALCATCSWAVPVQKWVQTTEADFEHGEAKGTAILALGQLALAPELKPLLKDPVPHIWALAVDPKGTVYAASGTEPKVLRLRDGKADVLFASPEKADIEILAVALAPDGALYAAAAPSGTLYRIAPDGKATVYYKSPDPYLWSLAVAPDGTLYAGTGPNGKLLKITAKDKATTLLAANARHILRLALAPDGTLYAGTDKQGLLYAINPKGQARVAYDAQEGDIRALALDPQGHLCFATAAISKSGSITPSATPSRSSIMRSSPTLILPSLETASEQPATPTARPSASAPSAPGAKVSATNAIYRLTPRGDVLQLASAQGVAYYALLWHKGQLYAGSGNDGKLFRVEDDTAIELADLEESQITAFAVAQGRLLLATANSGRIYEMAADHAPKGMLLSEVHDTSSQAHWGNVSWEGQAPRGTAITIATRTGNVAQPDGSWSPWSAECTRAQGERITSPVGRFIQYRATLTTARADATPTLDEITIAYVEANRRPDVDKVTLSKPPKPRRMVPQPQPGQPSVPTPKPNSHQVNTDKQAAPSPRGPFADILRIIWQAKDPNDDELVYSVSFRGEDETTWKKLEERLDRTFQDWDTHAVPDGFYRIRLVASDSPTNPPDQALEGDRVTEPFLIDNTPPAVANLAIRIAKDSSVAVTAQCTDAGSGLAEGEYSIDAGDWVSIVPTDGIFDSTSEAVEFKTQPLAKGEHTIVVRAKDDAENTGAAKTVFTIE